MGALALAGMISGAGQALERGTLNMQSGIIQQGLMQESHKWDQARMDATFAHDNEMLDKRIAADQAARQTELGGQIVRDTMQNQAQDARLDKTEAGADRRLDKSQTFEGQQKQADRTAHSEEKAADREQLDANKAEDRKLENRKLDLEEQHNKDWANIYGDLLKKRAEGKATPADDKRLDIYKDFMVAQANAIRDQLKDPMTSPEDKERLQGELKEMDTRLSSLLGLPPAPAPGSSGIVSPVPVPGAKPKPTPAAGGNATPGQAQAATPPTDWNALGNAMAPDPMGTFNQPAPATPPQKTNVVRQGKQQLAEAQAALQAARAQHADPSTIAQLEQTVRDLTARWGSQ